MPGYQAGSTFKMFTMLAALDAGMPLQHRVQLAACGWSSQYLAGAGEPGSLRRPLVPAERQRRDDRRADHVVRLRQVGQHLLRPAGADGRRREGGPDGRAARACSWRTDVDRMHGLAGAGATAGARSPSASPTRRRWRWPTRTRPSPPTASTASRCRCCRSPTPDGKPATLQGRRGRRAALPAGRLAGRRPGRHRRGPLRHRVRRGARRLRRLVDRAGRATAMVGRPVGRQDRHHRRHPVGLVRRLHAGAGGGELHRRPGQPVQRGRRRPVAQADRRRWPRRCATRCAGNRRGASRRRRAPIIG